MGSLTPNQNFDHVLIVSSGSDGMHDLQYHASIAASETWDRGALVSLDASGDFEAGLSTQQAMPMWAINATGDFDVDSDVGNFSATGVVGAFVATGGYEFHTTEYNTAGTYAPNTQLMADNVTDGLIEDHTDAPFDELSTRAVVGIVSKGEQTENYGQATLAFWPVYLPAFN